MKRPSAVVRRPLIWETLMLRQNKFGVSKGRRAYLTSSRELESSSSTIGMSCHNQKNHKLSYLDLSR